MGLAGGCSDVRDDREAAKSLVKLGASAIPEIERTLDSIEERSQRSEPAFHSAWLLYAYGKLKGPEAYTRLLRMVNNPGLADVHAVGDRAVALSLGLTSYVSRHHAPAALRMVDGRVFFCRPQEPRDGLDQMIFAWEVNDRRSFEATLGSTAKITFNELLDEKMWQDLRFDLWHGRPGPDVAVGYRFKVAGRWSAPEEALEVETKPGNTGVNAENIDLEVQLKDRSGRDCGTIRVNFTDTGILTGSLKYRIDSVDLLDLLRSITSCAGRE
jgi:hypothetical protein